ncbi:MAG: hypothetical protein IPL95_07060 [Saprospiraceae bacterium]|nr:hypothetical protein [Saprospiraceae bacterium]
MPSQKLSLPVISGTGAAMVETVILSFPTQPALLLTVTTYFPDVVTIF